MHVFFSFSIVNYHAQQHFVALFIPRVCRISFAFWCTCTLCIPIPPARMHSRGCKWVKVENHRNEWNGREANLIGAFNRESIFREKSSRVNGRLSRYAKPERLRTVKMHCFKMSEGGPATALAVGFCIPTCQKVTYAGLDQAGELEAW